MLDPLENLFSGGRIAEIILIALAAEALAVGVFAGRRGLRRAEWLWLLASAAGLVWALRMSLMGTKGAALALPLGFALLCHCAQLYCRFRAGPGRD